MTSVDREILLIIDKIVSTIDCEVIYLFGSHAYGNPRVDSDLDIYVVIPDGSDRPLDVMQRIYVELAKDRMKVPIDVLAAYASDFRRNAKSQTLERKVKNEGIKLYEKHNAG